MTIPRSETGGTLYRVGMLQEAAFIERWLATPKREKVELKP